MIALDSNVVLRYLLGDDEAQAKSVRELLDEAGDRGEAALVTDPVLCELDWVLRFSFRLDREARVKALRAMLDDPVFRFEDRDRVVEALVATAEGKADLSDHLIGLRGRGLGASTTYTFDRALKSDRRFTRL